MRSLGAERRERIAAARLYLVCDSKPGGRELAEVLRAAVAGVLRAIADAEDPQAAAAALHAKLDQRSEGARLAGG
jgi:thiamine monophosphate synthase